METISSSVHQKKAPKPRMALLLEHHLVRIISVLTKTNTDSVSGIFLQEKWLAHEAMTVQPIARVEYLMEISNFPKLYPLSFGPKDLSSCNTISNLVENRERTDTSQPTLQEREFYRHTDVMRKGIIYQIAYG